MASGIPKKIESLLHGACTDPYHDFSHAKKYGNMFNPITSYMAHKPGLFEAKSGLPVQSDIPATRTRGNADTDELHNENQLLQRLFSNVKIGSYSVPAEMENTPTLMKDLFDAIDKTPEKIAPVSFLNTLELGGYTLRLLKDSTGETNINRTRYRKEKRKGGKVVRPENKGSLKNKDLFDFIGRQSEINLLMDACSIDILSLFTDIEDDGAASLPLTANWLVNREFLNDPAKKTWFERIEGRSKRNTVRFLLDDEGETITYSNYMNKNAEFMRNMFFSVYEFKLSPLEIENREAPNIRLEIFDDKQNIHSSCDPKTDNEIGSCCSRISEYVSEGMYGKTNMIAVNYQAKRSGDWLQALSCLDINRRYRAYDTPKRNGSSLLNKNIVIVTHDRVLLWYSLMIGLDAIFVGGKGKEATGDDEEEEEESADKLYAAYFSNDKRGKSPAEIIREQFVRIEELTEAKIRAVLTKIDTYTRNYELIREKRLQLIKDKYSDVIETEGAKGLLKIKDLLAEFIRYSSLDYSPMEKESLERLYVAYQTAKREKKDEQTRLQSGLNLLSIYTLYDIKLSKFTTIEDIERSDTFSRDAQMFNLSLPVFHTSKVSRSARAGSSVDQVRKNHMDNMTNLSDEICKLLDETKLKLLKEYLDGEIATKVLRVSGITIHETHLGILISAINTQLKEDPETIIGNINFLDSLNSLTQKQAELFSRPDESLSTPLTSIVVAKKVAVETVASSSAASAKEVTPVTSASKMSSSSAVASSSRTSSASAAEPPEAENEEDEATIEKRLEVDALRHSAKRALLSSEKEEVKVAAILAFITAKKQLAELELKKLGKGLPSKGKVFNIIELSTAKDAYDDAVKAYNEKLSLSTPSRGTRGRVAVHNRELIELGERKDEAEKIYKFILSQMDTEAVASSVPPSASAATAETAGATEKASSAASSLSSSVAASSSAASSLSSSVAASLSGAVSNIRKRLYTTFSVLPTRRKVSKLLERFASEKGASAAGGSREKEIWAHFLYISYISELLHALSGFESAENLDYQYYDGLARLVLAYLQSVMEEAEGEGPLKYLHIIQFLYNTIPTSEWDHQGDFETNIAFVGKGIALNAINQMIGDVPDFGYTATITDPVVALYEQLSAKLKGQPFHERQYYLQYELYSAMNIPFDNDMDFPNGAEIASTTSTTSTESPILPNRNFSNISNENIREFMAMPLENRQEFLSSLSPQELNILTRQWRRFGSSVQSNNLSRNTSIPVGGKRRTYKKRKSRTVKKTRRHRR